MSFRAYIALIDAAEKLLTKAGQKTAEQRLITLRGIYYGTTWSLDYDVESKRSVPAALIRNAGFLTYTMGNSPKDPRPAFGKTTLLRDLKNSQSMVDSGRSADMGHLLIGLETRTNSARTTMFPEGGTGLEVVTWMGDLGGGAANLARKRVKTPSLAVDYVFHNSSSDYGVSDNLEGDVAAYLVAAGGTPGGAAAFGSGGVADVLRAYLLPATASAWRDRAASFVKAVGGTTSSKGITNKTDLINSLAKKLTEFGYWYAATRWVPTGELVGQDARRTCELMQGAAREIATVFVETLSTAIAAAPAKIDAEPPYPTPTLGGTCNSVLLKLAAIGGSVQKPFKGLLD
ncbi:hypothetical protein ACIBCN_19040 [Nocardia sp. NPDC051052]|uniref:hypothetical protein n=1 Tax=Nocardia sp. NPDC051052 TaxID=3364322 RepID=UPI00379DB2C2